MARSQSDELLESPPIGTLVALAVVLAAGGFGLARLSLDVDRAAAATRADEARALSAPEDVPAPAVVPDVPSPVPEAPTAIVADAGVAAPDVVAPIPEPTPLPPADGPAGTIIEGRVAYLRCEGLANIPPSGPCPRDHSVEARVWEAVRALPTSCSALRGREGSSDVRVVFDGPRMSGLGFRDLPDELEREAVRACLEPSLERVRTGLGTSRLTASFRFELTR